MIVRLMWYKITTKFYIIQIFINESVVAYFYSDGR